MKALTILTISISLFLFIVAATAQEKKMDENMYKDMMQMMQDSTMMNMMMEHIAKDDHMHGMMMHKMMAACKSDTSKMMGMCKAMMQDKDMHPMMMKMMKVDKIEPKRIESKKMIEVKKQNEQEDSHEEHRKKQNQ